MKFKELEKVHPALYRNHPFEYDCLSKTILCRDIAKAFKRQHTSIIDVQLKIFVHKKNDWHQEYVVVTYKGGAIAVRNNNANSVGATYNNIGQLIYGGYYDEVESYKKYLQSEDWELLEFPQNINLGGLISL